MIGDDDRERWNHKHGEVQVGGWVPRPWLVDHHALLTDRLPGRALDVACGRGRESLYLAGLGFEVDAVDVSDVAVDAVREAAGAQGLSVRVTRADLVQDRAPLVPAAYAVVMGFYFLERALLPAMADALAPGGLLFYETFTRDHVDLFGGRMGDRFMLDRNELLRAFAGLRVLRYRETVIGGERPRAIASLVAQKG